MKLRNKKLNRQIQIIVLLITSGFFSLSAQSPADDLFSRGRDSFSNKSYAEAVKNFEKFLDLYDDDPRADGVNYMRSVSLFYIKDYIGAIDSFDIFNEKYNDSAYKSRVSYWLGLSYYALKDYRKAAEKFLDQTNYHSEIFFLSRSFLYLGESYEKADMEEKALDAYKNGILAGREEKILSQTRLKLGILYFNRGDFDSAREQFTEILNNSIDNKLVADSQFYIGESLYYTGEFEEAASKLQFYLFMNSNSKYREEAVFRLGDIYQNLGMTDEAVKYLDLLLRDYPDGKYYLDGLRILGKTWKQAGEGEKAVTVYKKIIELSNDNYEIQRYNFEIAMMRIDSGDNIEAEKLLKESLKGPDNEKTRMSLYYLGQLLISDNRNDEGMIYLNRLVDNYPESSQADDASLNIAQYLLEINDKHRLALFIGSQMNRDTSYLDYFLYLKGGLDEEEGNIEDAIYAYNRIIDEFPNSEYLVEALHHKGKLMILSGQENQAVSILDLAFNKAESEKKRTDILVDKALLLYDMGRLEEADSAFSILLDKDVDFPRKDEILYRQGQLSLENRQYKDAADFFRRSAEAGTGERSIDALFKMGRSYFYMLNYKTSEKIFSELADKVASTSERKEDAMKMTALSIFLQQDWTRTVQFSDLLVTSLGIYPKEIRLLKLISLLALERNDAYERELNGLGDQTDEEKLIKNSLMQLLKIEKSSVLLIFRSQLAAYPDESAEVLATLLMTDLMYISSDKDWIEETHNLLVPLIKDKVLSIAFDQAYNMNR